MARPVWCRWDDCRQRWLVLAGSLAPICATCQRDARWSYEPGNWLKPKKPREPPAPLVITETDYRLLLRRLRISRD